MIGRRAPASRFSRRSKNNCSYTNPFCRWILIGLVVAAFALHQQKKLKSSFEEIGRPSDPSSMSSGLRASIVDVPVLLTSNPKDKQEIVPPVNSDVTIVGYYDEGDDRYGLEDDDFSASPRVDDTSVKTAIYDSISGGWSRKNPLVKIQRVALLGERNTGTRWMSSELAKCFPTLNVQPRLVRWKHWFQHDLPHTDGSAQESTLVISQFRNVYDWVEAMKKVPHHAPLHLHKNWKDFLTTPWTMERPIRDIPYKSNLFTAVNKTTQQPVTPLCFEKFYYNQIVSCIEGSRNDTSYTSYGCNPNKDFSCHKPNYELKHNINMKKLTGKAYGSIIEMRRDKIINFVKEIKEFLWVVDVIDVQYEKLLSDGTEFLLNRIENITGVKRRCESTPKQTRKKREISQDMMKWLNNHVDWEVESLIGYRKIDIVDVDNLDKMESKDEYDEGGDDKYSDGLADATEAEGKYEDEDVSTDEVSTGSHPT